MTMVFVKVHIAFEDAPYTHFCNCKLQSAILTVSSISAEKKAITSSRCYKKFGGDLDFPKIKKMKNVCSDI